MKRKKSCNKYLFRFGKGGALEINLSIQAYLYKAVRNSFHWIKSNMERFAACMQKKWQHSLLNLNRPAKWLFRMNCKNKFILQLKKFTWTMQDYFQAESIWRIKDAEIAEHLSISVKTVENQMGKALKIMREQLKDYLPLVIMFFHFLFHDLGNQRTYRRHYPKFLAGEATLEEKQLWGGKSLNSSNSQNLTRCHCCLPRVHRFEKDVNVNADLAWSKVQSGLHQTKTVVIPMQSGLNRTVWLRIAAVFVLIAVFGAVLYFSLQPLSSSNVEFATSDSTQKTMLPDGSEITLNKHSSIQYASASYSNKRIIKLQRRSIFNVKHDEKIPFFCRGWNIAGSGYRKLLSMSKLTGIPEL